jgi:hypothetical protein
MIDDFDRRETDTLWIHVRKATISYSQGYPHDTYNEVFGGALHISGRTETQLIEDSSDVRWAESTVGFYEEEKFERTDLLNSLTVMRNSSLKGFYGYIGTSLPIIEKLYGVSEVLHMSSASGIRLSVTVTPRLSDATKFAIVGYRMDFNSRICTRMDMIKNEAQKRIIENDL